MLHLCIILIVIGILAIILELLMPGFDSFISGIIGVVALVASSVLAVLFVPGGWLVVALNFSVISFAAIMFSIFIRRKQIQGRIILSDALAEDTPHVNLLDLVGQEGKTISSLRPYGEAEFNGVRVEVRSGGSIIQSGTQVRVIDIQANNVIVSAID